MNTSYMGGGKLSVLWRKLLFCSIFLSFLCSPHLVKAQWPPASYNSLPLNVKRQLAGPSFMVGNFYSLADSYADFNGALGLPASDASNTTLLSTDARHDNLGNALQGLGFKNYYRHFKTQSFKRFPECNPGEEFHNLLYHSTGACTTPTTPTILDRMVQDGQSLGLTTGLYMQAMSDFFYQMDYKTGNPLDGFIDKKLSECMCRTLEVGTNYDLTVPVSDFASDLDFIPSPTAAEDLSSYSVQNDGLQQSAYYLCPNCPEWRARLGNRLAAVRNGGADFVFFDVDHMSKPKKGCFCRGCRIRYAQFKTNGACATNGNIDNCLTNNYAMNKPLIGSPAGIYYVNGAFYNPDDNTDVYSTTQYRAMAILTNLSLTEHFEYLQNIMHGSNSQQGTLGVVTTGEFPGLTLDDHRASFVRTLDMPKGEWSMPSKFNNNKIFLSTDPASGQLINYRIHEDIRLMGSLVLYRDISKHRLVLLRLSGKVLMPGSLNSANLTFSQVAQKNNLRLKTWVGAGTVLGVTNSTTLSPFFDVNTNTAAISYTNKDLWSFKPNLTVNGVTLTPAIASTMTDIVALGNKFDGLIYGMRPYIWCGVYFGETAKIALTYASGESESSIQLWQKQLMPMLLGYHAMANGYSDAWVPTVFYPPNGGIPYTQLGVGSIKRRHHIYPTGFVTEFGSVPTDMKVLLTQADVSVVQTLPAIIPRVSLPTHVNSTNGGAVGEFYRINDPGSISENLIKNTFSSVIGATSTAPAPFYIKSTPRELKQQASGLGNQQDERMHASFFVPTNYYIENYSPCKTKKALVVPLVSDPAWGIPKESWADYEIDVVEVLDPITQVMIPAAKIKYGQVEDQFFIGTYTDPSNLFNAIGPNQSIVWNRVNNSPTSPNYNKFKFLYENGLSTETISLADTDYKKFTVRNAEVDPASTGNNTGIPIAITANSYQLFLRNDWINAQSSNLGIENIKWHNSTTGLPVTNITYTIGATETVINIPAFTHTAAIEVNLRRCPDIIEAVNPPSN